MAISQTHTHCKDGQDLLKMAEHVLQTDKSQIKFMNLTTNMLSGQCLLI